MFCSIWIEPSKHQNLQDEGRFQTEIYVIESVKKYSLKVLYKMTHHILTEPPVFLGSTQITLSKSLDFSGITNISYEISFRKAWCLQLFLNFHLKRWFETCVKIWNSYSFVKTLPTTFFKNGFNQKGFW